MTWKLIDVYAAQGAMNWDAVRAAYRRRDHPVRLRQRRARSGRRAVRAQRCGVPRRLGIPFGVYLYSYAENDAMAESEADHMLRKIAEIGGGLSLPAYLDVEQPGLEWYFKRACEVVGPKVEAAGSDGMVLRSRERQRAGARVAALHRVGRGVRSAARLRRSGGHLAVHLLRVRRRRRPARLQRSYRDLPAEITGTGSSRRSPRRRITAQQPTPDGDLPAIRLRAQTEDGTVLPWTEHPDYAGWDDNGAITYLCVDCEWPVDVQAHTQASG